MKNKYCEFKHDPKWDFNLSSKAYNLLLEMILNDFKSGIIHYINTDYRVSSTILSLLWLRLDFISASSDYLDKMYIKLIVYSKYSKAKLSQYRF